VLQQNSELSQSAAKSLNVKSALNPMLWLTAIVTPLCFGSAYVLKESSIFEVLIGAGLFPILITCIGFIYFAIFKAEKLQSEDYQIRHESLQIIQQKSGTSELPIASLENIVNPQAKSIVHQESN